MTTQSRCNKNYAPCGTMRPRTYFLPVRPRLRLVQRRLHAVPLTLAFARLAAAQSGTITGVVRDSIGHHPLAGAVVQIVAADSVGRSGHTVVSDSLGRYTFTSVPAGRYLLAF